jgi:pimeloyl-ACP methyl ester carboxylesterase/DNA-binding CsgD family transcriptional regulator
VERKGNFRAGYIVPVGAQAIRFTQSFDGTRIAFAVTGSGLPLVRAPHWLTHLEYEFQSALWKEWISTLSEDRRLLRMDLRACGLSDAEGIELSFDAYVRDLEAVVDAAGFTEPFALFGHSQGAASAIEYAARHPGRVSHLVLLGGYGRGLLHRNLPPEALAEYEAQLMLVAAGWGRDDASYRQMFAMQFIPGGTLEQINSMSDLQRAASTPGNATRLIRSFFSIDVTGAATRVRCPTLILHARGDRRVPFEEGRVLAGLIPDARMVTLETENHILLPQEPAFETFFSELAAFLPRSGAAAARRAFAELTPREAEILEHIARGRDNARIAAELGVSEKTVRNNVTSIFDKLGVETRAEAIVRAREHGLGVS